MSNIAKALGYNDKYALRHLSELEDWPVWPRIEEELEIPFPQGGNDADVEAGLEWAVRALFLAHEKLMARYQAYEDAMVDYIRKSLSRLEDGA